MSLLAELKRRNVIRMAGLYLVGAWLLTQVASTVFPAFDVPAWALRALIIVLVIGFVPALIFAWVFELTPSGIKRDAEVSPEESIAPLTARRMDRMIIVVLICALVYFGIDKFVLGPRRDAAIPARSEQATNARAMAQSDHADVGKSRGRIEIEKVPPFPDNDPYTVGIAVFILSTLDGNRSSYQTIISTGGLGIIRDTGLVREILDYYAAVDGVRHFEVGLEQNRDKLIDAERQLGISPVQGQTLAEFVAILHANAPLLATAQNYWLYTNRHLKLIGELRAGAERLAKHLEQLSGGFR